MTAASSQTWAGLSDSRGPEVALHLDEPGFDFYISIFPHHRHAEVEMALDAADLLGYEPIPEDEREYLVEEDGSIRLYLIPKEHDQGSAVDRSTESGGATRAG